MPRFQSLAEIKAAIEACDTIEEVRAMPDQTATLNCFFEYNQEFPRAGNRDPIEVLFEATRKEA